MSAQVPPAGPSASPSSTLASSSTALLARLHPALYLSQHLAHSSRPSSSSKSPLDFPAVQINPSPLVTSSSRQPAGIPSPSALVRYGSTTVICNITPTIVYPDPIQGSIQAINAAAAASTSSSSSVIVPSISLTPLSSPSADFKSGPPSNYAQNVTERLYAVLDAALPFDQSALHIPNEGGDEDGVNASRAVRAKWCLFADCSVIGFDGGLLEASHLAIIAALRQLRLPRAHYSLDETAVIASPAPSDYWSLRDKMHSIPLSFSMGIYDGYLLAAPSSFESSLLSTSIHLALNFTPSATAPPPRVVAVNSTGPLSAPANVGQEEQDEDEGLLEKCIAMAVAAGKRTVEVLLQAEAAAAAGGG